MNSILISEEMGKSLVFEGKGKCGMVQKDSLARYRQLRLV